MKTLLLSLIAIIFLFFSCKKDINIIPDTNLADTIYYGNWIRITDIYYMYKPNTFIKSINIAKDSLWITTGKTIITTTKGLTWSIDHKQYPNSIVTSIITYPVIYKPALQISYNAEGDFLTYYAMELVVGEDTLIFKNLTNEKIN